MSQNLRYIVAGLLACILFTSISLSQSTFGSITGTVTDPAGAVVPGAEVEVTNEGTGAIRKVATTNSGVFNVPNLDVGRYKVRVTGAGFATYERGDLNLTANQIISIDVPLTLGATTTLVEVKPALSLLPRRMTCRAPSVTNPSRRCPWSAAIPEMAESTRMSPSTPE